MSSGEAAKNVQDSSSQREKVEEVPCIVKFRPCKDWSGEYGFDWVREGREDFEEKNRVVSSIASYGNDNDHVYAGYIPDDIAVDMLRKQKGDEEYEKWREEMRKNLTQNSDKFRIDENGKVIANDEELKKTLEILVDALASIEIREDVSLYDEKAWQSDSRIKVDENISEVDDGVQPMEYVYSPKYIKNVKYYLNSKDLAGIWRSEVEYEDMANGSKEAKEASYKLNYLIDTPSIILSLLKKGDGYVLPYYTTEKEDETISIDIEERIDVWKWDSVSKEWVFHETITGFEFFTKALKHVYDENYSLSKNGKYVDIVDPCKMIEYIQKGIRIELDYWHINGKTYLLAKWTESPLGKSYQVFYKDGNLISIDLGGWKRWVDLEAEERSEIKNTISPFFTEGVVLDRELDLPTILKKVKNKEIDDVIFTISGPYSLKEYNIPADELTKDSLNREFWNGNRIISWQEHYEDSFTHFNMRLKKEKRQAKKNDVIKYCVPELSISHEDIKRTHFKLNSSIDAPVKSTEPKNEYNLQIRYEGKCDELRFETDQPDSIVVEPSVIKNPKDKDIITVKYKGYYAPLVKINAIAVKKYLIKDTERLAGQLKVRVNLPKLFKILAIKVAIGGKGLSQKYEDCIDDQFDSLNNVFSQVGIKTEVINTDVDIDEAMFNDFLVDGKMDPYRKTWNDKKGMGLLLGDAVLTVLEDKYQYGERIALVLMQTVVFIFIDKSFCGKTSAFQWHSDIYHCKYEVFGQHSSFMRARIGVFAHESLHALNCGHVFQMRGDLRMNPFCFPYWGTSNIMDYSMVLYSLHKYQWDIIDEEYPNLQSQIQNNIIKFAMNDEKTRRELFIEKKSKQKRDRLF